MKARRRVYDAVVEDHPGPDPDPTLEPVGHARRAATGTVGAAGCHEQAGRSVRTGAETVRRWLEVLSGFYFGFLVRPWFRNVSRSLRKEPKWFLRDWSGVRGNGAKAETFVACHLLKAVEGWTDLGLGAFQLCYLRDKAGREVDFVVVRDGAPWFLVEVKNQETTIAPSLSYFQEQIGAPFAFQVVLEADYVEADCFARPGTPKVVPAKPFLSQLF